MKKLYQIPFIAATLMVCSGVQSTDASHEDSTVTVSKLEPRVDVNLLSVIEKINTKLDKMEKKIEESFNEITEKIESLDIGFSQKLENMKSDIRSFEERLQENIDFSSGRLETDTKNLHTQLEGMESRIVGKVDETTSLLIGSEDLNRSIVMCNASETISNQIDTSTSLIEQSIQIQTEIISNFIENTSLELLISLQNDTVCPLPNCSCPTPSGGGKSSNGSSSEIECKKRMTETPEDPDFPYVVIESGIANVTDRPILCDPVTNDGGWIVIQRRTKGDVDFYRLWPEYQKGFGNLTGDFWMGLDQIHEISTSGVYELRFDLICKDEPIFAIYDRFYIDGEDNKYKNTVGDFVRGTASNSFLREEQFTTKDYDNDGEPGNAARVYKGGWWYGWGDWNYVNPNGKWMAGNKQGPFWGSRSTNDPCTHTEMKIRRKD